MKFKESKLAHKYCVGNGIEIGAASHNPFNIEGCKFLACHDREEFWRKNEISMCGEYITPDYYGTAEKIPLEDNCLDYIVSSHVIEHVPNPINAFLEWDRVLNKNGIIFMIFPKRDADKRDAIKEISSLESFIEQHNNPKNLTDENGHIWIFTLETMLNLINYCKSEYNLEWDILKSLETDDKVGNGHCIICKKI